MTGFLVGQQVDQAERFEINCSSVKRLPLERIDPALDRDRVSHQLKRELLSLRITLADLGYRKGKAAE